MGKRWCCRWRMLSADAYLDLNADADLDFNADADFDLNAYADADLDFNFGAGTNGFFNTNIYN